MAASLDLGFVEKLENELFSKDFPSKLGGKPLWLNLKTLPPPQSLVCNKCDEQMIFLLQLYAPVVNDEKCFHRSLFVFMCKTSSCCQANNADNFIVFRCQLARTNTFYSYNPSAENDENEGPSAADFNKLCELCGCLAFSQCAKCKKVNYCSKSHQTIDWKTGHKDVCKGNNVCANIVKKSYLLPEFEIVSEPEDYQVQEQRPEADRMRDYENYKQNINQEEETKDLDEKELELFAGKKSDQKFQEFKKRTSHNSEQVLRYEKNGSPLWVSSENIPQEDEIPKCKCGAQRQFEFQILPQLLNHLGLDDVGQSVDWGTLAIYTCSQNCETDDAAYYNEFIWKQDFSDQINSD
ncbi:Programmed cell death protein 2 [Chamberlinius hualienensis]